MHLAKSFQTHPHHEYTQYSLRIGINGAENISIQIHLNSNQQLENDFNFL